MKSGATIRIGIHQGIKLRRSSDDADCAIEIASLLAVENDGIVMSGMVLAALDPTLDRFARPLDGLPLQIAAHAFDWRSEIPSAAYWGKTTWPDTEATPRNGPYLVLHHNLLTVELTQDKPVLTIGRDPQNSLTLERKHVSRNHCKIERREDCVMLTDSSFNGTFLVPDKGKELRVAKSSVILTGTGMLFLGLRPKGDRRGGIKYEAFNRK